MKTAPNTDEMLDRLMKMIKPIEEKEEVPLSEADGRTAAGAVYAPYDLPPEPVSACDGIAVRFDEKADGERSYALCNTGRILPPGFDTVIPVEETEQKDGRLRILRQPVKKGERVIPAGCRMRRGECLLEKGEILTPVQLGILCSAGIRKVSVRRRPRVFYIPTGEELVMCGTVPGPDQNVESNGIMVAAYVRRYGGTAFLHPVVADDPAELEAAIRQGTREADLVVIGAGSSKGEKDYTAAVLQKLGTDFYREPMKKFRRHCSLAAVDGTAVIGIPGPPEGARAMTERYVRAAAEGLLGQKSAPFLFAQAVAEEELGPAGADGRLDVMLSESGGTVRASAKVRFAGTRAELRGQKEGCVFLPAGTVVRRGETVLAEVLSGRF